MSTKNKKPILIVVSIVLLVVAIAIVVPVVLWKKKKTAPPPPPPPPPPPVLLPMPLPSPMTAPSPATEQLPIAPVESPVESVPAPAPPAALVATVPQTMVVYGNNGSITCDGYCAGVDGAPYNGELPQEWNGARCIATGRAGVACNSGDGQPITCTCEKTGTGWTPRPTQVVYGNNGSITCDGYCAGVDGAPYNGELPQEWNGARCIATGRAGVACNSGDGQPITCTCEKTGTGWA